MPDPTRQSVLFKGLTSKPVVATFDAAHVSSDGGLVLLARLDQGMRLTQRLAARLSDTRDADRVAHTNLELFRQRVFGVAAGYEDLNDAARTAADPLLKVACGRRAIEGASLGSQPTLSRFEHAQSGRDLCALERQLEEIVVDRHRRRLGRGVRRITIDMDPTEDPTHGQQPFAFFNGHYESTCYLPLFTFVSFDDEPDQYLCGARLRPGTASCARGAIPRLRRLIARLRGAFPRAVIRVRLDGGFSTPRVLDFLDEAADEYAVAIGGNPRLLRAVEPLMVAARVLSEVNADTARLFGDFSYAADSWSRERRIVAKAEVTRLPDREPRDNPRFVTVKLPRRHAEEAYSIYGGRGEIENRIKELKLGLRCDRTSATSFLANQLRVLVAATAFVLFQELRLRAREAQCLEVASAQVTTLRERLLKIGTRVVESVRRVVLHFPVAFPWTRAWCALARAIGAT